MVKIGQTQPVDKKSSAREPIVEVPYDPPEPYGLDLEVFAMSEFRRRVSAEYLRRSQRVEFHALLHVTRGRFTHTP